MHNDWYLATTKRRQELRAVEELANQEINSYCPDILVEKLSRGKVKLVREALFTGYIFVNIGLSDAKFSKVRSTRGVKDWVRFGHELAKIPNDLIKTIELATSDEGTPHIRKRFEKGESIRVLSGAFTGLEGVFDKNDGDERALVLIEILGNQSTISLSNEHISR